MLAKLQGGRSAPTGPRLRHHFALDLYDWLFAFGNRPVSFAIWRKRFAAESGFDTAVSRWKRLRAKIRAAGVPHETIWLHTTADQPDRIHIRLLTGARRMVDRSLPPVPEAS